MCVAGSNLTTNLRDFFSRATSRKASKKEEQDLKGFGGPGACVRVSCGKCQTAWGWHQAAQLQAPYVWGGGNRQQLLLPGTRGLWQGWGDRQL